MKEKMFEVATRTKMRFPFRGMVSVEDLWDLSAKNLDQVFKALNAQVKQVNEDSLLTTRTKEDDALQIQIEIVKHIFETKSAEENARLQEKEKKEKKQKILSLIEKKQEEALGDKTVEELMAELAELD